MFLYDKRFGRKLALEDVSLEINAGGVDRPHRSNGAARAR
jgi:hypothetical protein